MKAAIPLVLIALVVAAAGCRRAAPPAPAATQPAAGEPASAPPAAEAVAEIAAYPGATQLGRKEAINKDGFARVVEVKLHSTAAFADIKAFYANVVAAGGWQVTASEEKADEAEWKLAKGTAVAKIELEGTPTGGVEIAIERKDR